MGDRPATIGIGAKVVGRARYVAFQMAWVAIWEEPVRRDSTNGLGVAASAGRSNRRRRLGLCIIATRTLELF